MLVLEKKILNVFTIYGHGGHLGQWTTTILAIFRSPNLRRLHIKFEQHWPSGFRGEVVWNSQHFSHTTVLQKVLSLGSDYFSVTFYQTYFYYKPSRYSPFTETHFVTFLPSREKQINRILDVYLFPESIFLSLGNIKKSQGFRSGE